MHPKITFLRHGHLSGKYADYGQLSFSELRDLGLNIGNYPLDFLSPPIKDTFEKFDTCFVSNISRTQESAQMIGFSLPTKTALINEIWFDLGLILNEREYSIGGGLQIVRTALWKAFFGRKNGIEAPELVMERLQIFLDMLRLETHRNILIISHGFLLQIIQCLLVHKTDFTKITYEDFLHLSIPPIEYWRGFEY